MFCPPYPFLRRVGGIVSGGRGRECGECHRKRVFYNLLFTIQRFDNITGGDQCFSSALPVEGQFISN
jgi:hypothetical protein